MNNRTYDSRIGMHIIPIPTNRVLPTNSTNTMNRDNIINPMHSSYSVIVGNSNTISDDILYYIVYNSDSIISDKNVYNRHNQTFSDIITKRINNDSRFRDTYLHCVTMLKAPTIANSITNKGITIDRYYRNISRIHTDIAISISRCLPTDSRKTITTPNGISVDISLIISDIQKHIKCSNDNIGKTITLIDSYTNSEIITCPTTPVNHIKKGSQVTTLLTDDRCSRYNNKGVKDIIPATTPITTCEYISTLRAMRIDSGIAPSVIWTGNSRDYMIIGIMDYDTTNYYVVYSSEVYTDSEIYQCIYNDYNGIYDSYRKYAMDTSIQKYLSVFNDPEYVSWAFNVQKGIIVDTPISINKDSIHKTYLYDDEYYYYSTHKDNIWEEWDNVVLETSSIRKYIPTRMRSIDIISTIHYYANRDTPDIQFVGGRPTLTLSGYIGNVVDSINYYTDNGNSKIVSRAIEYINRYITIFTLDGKDTTNLEDSKVVLLEEYAKTLNKDNGYLYKDDLFDPYTEKMYKGRKGIDTINTDSIYNPTYVTSWKHMNYATHRKGRTIPTNTDLFWYRSLRARYIDGSGGICRTNPYKYYGGTTTTTTHSSNVPTLPSIRSIAISMGVSDVLYNRWASTTPNPTSPHYIPIKPISRDIPTNKRDPKRSIMYSSKYKRSDNKRPTTMLYSKTQLNTRIYHYNSCNTNKQYRIYNNMVLVEKYLTPTLSKWVKVGEVDKNGEVVIY